MEFMMNDLNETIKAQLLEVAENLSSGYETYDCGECNIEEIEHDHYDGFMTFTNGGFSVSLITDLMNFWSSGAEVTCDRIAAAMQETIDTCASDSRQEFYRDNKEALDKAGIAESDTCYHTIEKHGLADLAESLDESFRCYLTEGGEFWLQMRAQFYSADNYRNQTGADEICFIGGVNTDYGYGRDCGLDATFEKTYKVERLTAKRIAVIVAAMGATI